MKAGVGDTISNYTALYDWKLGCEENSDRPNDFAYMLLKRRLLRFYILKLNH